MRQDVKKQPGRPDNNRSSAAGNRGRRRFASERERCFAWIAQGVSVKEAASRLGVARQTVSRWINEPPSEEYRLRITYLYRQQPCTMIYVNFFANRIKIVNRTGDILHRAFGVVEEPDWEQFEIFLRERCFPQTRANAKELLEALGIDNYDPLQIVEKTQGRMAEDSMWMKFTYYGIG